MEMHQHVFAMDVPRSWTVIEKRNVRLHDSEMDPRPPRNLCTAWQAWISSLVSGHEHRSSITKENT